MIGMMQGASCPVHLVISKWDIVRGFSERSSTPMIIGCSASVVPLGAGGRAGRPAVRAAVQQGRCPDDDGAGPGVPATQRAPVPTPTSHKSQLNRSRSWLKPLGQMA